MLLLLFFALDSRYKGETIDVGGSRGPREITHSRQHIPESPYLIAGTPGRYFTRRSYDHGHTNTSFVQVALNATERSVAIEEFRIGATLFMGSVIAGKENIGIIIEPKRFQ